MEGTFGAYETSIFKAVCTGTVIGAVLFLVGTTAMSWVVGFDFGPAIALGAFTAFWGGAGFGGMFGAIAAATRHEREISDTVVPSRQATSEEASIEARQDLAA